MKICFTLLQVSKYSLAWRERETQVQENQLPDISVNSDSCVCPAVSGHVAISSPAPASLWQNVIFPWIKNT